MSTKPPKPRQARPIAHNVYSVYLDSKHNRLGLRRVMFSMLGILPNTRSTTPNHHLLAVKGLSWSEINRPKPNWKSEAIDCLVFGLFLIGLLFFWLVLPEMLG